MKGIHLLIYMSLLLFLLTACSDPTIKIDNEPDKYQTVQEISPTEVITTDDTEPEIISLEIIIGPAVTNDYTNKYKIILNSEKNSCRIEFIDRHGEYMPKGFRIDETLEVNELPFNDFLTIFNNYGFMELNGTYINNGSSKDAISILINYSDESRFSYYSDVLPDDYKSFKDLIINKILEIYNFKK